MRFLLISILLMLSYRGILAQSNLESNEGRANNQSMDKYFCDEEVFTNMTHQLELLENAYIKMQREMSLLLDVISENQRLLKTTSGPTLQKNPQQPITTRIPKTCEEALEQSNNPTDGIYQIHLPDSDLKPFFVYCLVDPNYGTAWTIIQRRQDNTTDFYRELNDYELGFGNLETEFFIGLDKLHALTNAQLNELWIILVDFENDVRSARYDSFAIGNEDEKYALNVLGVYSGDAGDSLRDSQGMKFTTKDADNDYNKQENNAILYTGAWWYRNHLSCNLNGRYLDGKVKNVKIGEGIVWQGWRGYEYSLKYTHMAIRPRI